MYAIAYPTSAASVEPTLQLPDPPQTNPTTNRLVMWGECLFSPFLLFDSARSPIPYGYTRPRLVDLKHLVDLPPDARQIANISASEMHALVLTKSGQVLSWGTFNKSENTAGISPYRDGVSWRRPRQLDPALWANVPVVDVAAMVGNSAVLLSSGSIVLWGSYAYPIGGHKRSVEEIDVAEQSNPNWDLNANAYIITQTGSFTAIRANGPVLAALESYQSTITTIGITGGTWVSHTAPMANGFVVKDHLFAATTDGFVFVSSAGGGVLVVGAYAITGTSASLNSTPNPRLLGHPKRTSSKTPTSLYWDALDQDIAAHSPISAATCLHRLLHLH